VGDEVYAELLSIVARRRTGEVFPFVAKLVEAGVDLVAFADGAGDLWRAALAVRLGAKPDGVSAALANVIRAGLGDLASGDLLRVLRSLEESEEAIARGGNPRLALETLLVRWAMMDRTVEIQALLAGGGEGRGVTKARGEVQGARVEQTPAGVGAPAAAPADGAVRSHPPPRTSNPVVPLTVESLRQAWPAVVEALREDGKRLIAEALMDTEVVSIEGGAVTVRALGGNPLTPDALERGRSSIAAAASRVLGAAVQVELERPAAPAAPQSSAPVAAKPQRFSVSAANAERAKALRGKDPALDSAMDTLDLELLD
jgi:DNA polymerase-3 subunit gamma/tau